MDCSSSHIKGSFSLESVNWGSDLPSFMPFLASIDLTNNSIINIRKGSSGGCNRNIKNVLLIDLRSNPELEFVHEHYADNCPSLVLDHDLRECKKGSEVDMALVLNERRTLVCHCANGTFCTDDGYVKTCSHQEFLASNLCLPCPFGSTSPTKAISITQCVAEGQAIDLLGIWLSIAFVVVAGVYAILVKVKFEKQYSKIIGVKYWAPLIALLSMYDFLTDCLFLTQSAKGDHRSLTYACAAFLLLPILLNLMCLIALFVFEFATRHEIDDESHDFQIWFSKSNRAFVSAMLLLGVTNPGVISLLESRLFGSVTLSAPFKARTFLRFHPVVNNLAEDVPQLVLQVYSLALQSDFSVVTILSVSASIMALLTGLISKALVGCMVSIKNDRAGSVAMQQRHLSTKLLESPREDARLQRATM